MAVMFQAGLKTFLVPLPSSQEPPAIGTAGDACMYDSWVLKPHELLNTTREQLVSRGPHDAPRGASIAGTGTCVAPSGATGSRYSLARPQRTEPCRHRSEDTSGGSVQPV